MAVFILYMFIGETFGEQGPQNGPGIKIYPGKTYDLKKNDSVKGGTWHSSDASVTSVDSVSGIIKGVSLGSATITHRYNTGIRNIPVQIVEGPSKLHDSIMLGLLFLVWLGLVAVWWKERLGAWLTIIAILTIVLSTSYANGIHLWPLRYFLLGMVPAVTLLVCAAVEKKAKIV